MIIKYSFVRALICSLKSSQLLASFQNELLYCCHSFSVEKKILINNFFNIYIFYNNLHYLEQL